jgi:SAM-dependent methyltransferase
VLLVWLFFLLVFVSFGLIVFVGAPYVPTKQKDLDNIFASLKLKKGAKVVDLGSGDGRVLIAATKSGYEAVGYELNPILVFLTKLRIRKIPRAEIKLSNYWGADLADYQLVFIFSAQPFMNRLAAKLKKELKKGSIVVSYGFRLPGQKSTRAIGAANVYKF